MSVFSTITSDELLPQDIRQALNLDDKDAVYSGRYPRPVRRPFEVWVEGAASRQLPTLTHANQHPFRLHVRTDLATLGADQSAAAAMETLKAHMETLRDRYDGSLNTADTDYIARIPGLICWTAEEETVDEDPVDSGVLDGIVFVAALVRR